jgi:hypothetical protein
MRKIDRISLLLTALILAASSGCSFIAAILGMEQSQRDWVGDPAEATPRNVEESMKLNSEIDRIYH